MTHSVYHRDLGIELNLTLDDLGHPEHPDLLQDLHRNYRPGMLYCIEAHEDGGVACPGFMAIRIRNGRPHAMHVNVGECEETAAESDLHKALKEHTALTADREGFAAYVEEQARHRRRRTDVIVTGVDGRKLGYEIQLSAIAKGNVDKRTRIARDDGLLPLWLVNDQNAIPIDRASWARVEIHDWKIVGREVIPVRGGVKTLHMARCDETSPRPCPIKGTRRCWGWHGQWQATLGLRYEDVVRKTATGELVPLYYESPDRRRGWHMWVTPEDKVEFLQGRPEPSPYEPRSVTATSEDQSLVPNGRDTHCHYLEDTGIRNGPMWPRDSGEPIDASDWASQPPPEVISTNQQVDGFTIPGDLVAAQRAFYDAEKRCERIAATHPSAMDIAAGKAQITVEHYSEIARAREERQRLVEILNDHPWWDSIDNRHLGKRALRAAAREVAQGAASRGNYG